jgi:plastocyanin
VWAPTNVEPHDVHLKQGPKGLKKKGSYSTRTTAVTNATFKHAFPTPGTYKFICTIHPTKMKMTVTVKR